ncbi:unnamed protein product [Cladocopium goreaui]|uniref:AI-2E family transporter n=1 Tax=Cladocopium goreaui TaxID=2562237 RepID=A0A9P1DBU5_9DINO|nr:unnamed protein product [Cladocopium goreaui]
MMDPEAEARGDPTSAPTSTSKLELPTVSLVILATLASVFALYKLQSVLVPLTLAIGFAQLFQPMVCWLSRLPSNLWRCVRWLLKCRRAPRPADGGEISLGAAQAARSADGAAFLGAERSPSMVSAGTASLVEEVVVLWSPSSLRNESKRQALCRRLQLWGQGLWDIVAVLLCTAFLIGLLILFVWSMVQAFQHFDFTKYKNSYKITSFLAWLKRHGVDISKMDWSSIWNTFRGQLLDTLNAMIAFSEGIILTALMFFFCLYALLPSAKTRRKKHGIKHLMQRYLLWKTVSSAVIGAAVGFCLGIMKVDLAFVFGILTFFLNFIPNVGAAIAELLPVPLVLLAPDRTVSDAFLVFLIPFIIHNVLGCILENKLMQHGLDLHPLIVVIALTFWSSVWGVAGAILSVPLTSVIRLWLEELENPYAQTAFMLINGPQSKPPKEVEPVQVPDGFHTA